MEETMHQEPRGSGPRWKPGTRPLELDIVHMLQTRLTILAMVGGDLEPLDDRLDDDRRRLMERTFHRHTRMLNIMVTKGYVDCSI
jgi:hypothetical protein